MKNISRKSAIKEVNDHLRRLNKNIDELSANCDKDVYVGTFAIERYADLLSKRDEKRYFIGIKKIFCDDEKYNDWMASQKTDKEKIISYANFMVKRFVEYKLKFEIPKSTARTESLVCDLKLDTHKRLARFWRDIVGKENIKQELSYATDLIGIFAF